jgi:hypothetical protein
MAASPYVLIKNGSGSFINPDSPGDPNYPAGVNVTPGNTIFIKLLSADSVGQWNLKVVGTDEDTALPFLTGVDPTTGLVSTPNTVVTFVAPAGVAGRTYIFQSIVNNGGPAYTKTFGIYTLTLNAFRVAAVGERFENDPLFGWARTINQFIKRSGIPLQKMPGYTWVAPDTQVPESAQTGNIQAPFSTLQQAFASFPDGYSQILYLQPASYLGQVVTANPTATVLIRCGSSAALPDSNVLAILPELSLTNTDIEFVGCDLFNQVVANRLTAQSCVVEHDIEAQDHLILNESTLDASNLLVGATTARITKTNVVNPVSVTFTGGAGILTVDSFTNASSVITVVNGTLQVLG